MLKSNLRLVILAVIILIAASLSCGAPTGDRPAWETPQSDQDTCYATPYLSVTSQVTNQETNQFGTRICEYHLEITSAYPSGGVYFFVFQHRADGYQGTEDFDWMGNILLGPGESDRWDGYVNIYTDPDASGPVLAVPERIAGVFDEPQCADERQNLEYLTSISIPIEPVCPLE